MWHRQRLGFALYEERAGRREGWRRGTNCLRWSEEIACMMTVDCSLISSTLSPGRTALRPDELDGSQHHHSEGAIGLGQEERAPD